jgi:hypothetical protein
VFRVLVSALLVAACAGAAPGPAPSPGAAPAERVRVLDLYPGVTATIVEPERRDPAARVELILYALPNGNSTAETMGRAPDDSAHWRFDIQHIAAQTRALRQRAMPNAIVVYLEADSKSWPEWRRRLGYDRANARIVGIVDQLRLAVGDPDGLAVTLTGHSGGGSFMSGFIDGQPALPAWLERIAYLDANYSFEYRHGDKLVSWLRGDPRRTLLVMAYDDREITLDGRRVVSDSGGTWRASSRMMNYLREPYHFRLDTLGEFLRYRASQVDVLLHPNRENRILHTEMIGEMNGFMHAMLARRPAYEREASALARGRAYSQFVEPAVSLPPATAPEIPPRDPRAPTGSAFIAAINALSREEREAAIRREILSGNIPEFLRAFRSVAAEATGPDSVRRVVSFDVMPDYLAIGSDADHVRIPMSPYTAQAFADAFGFVLPTRKMVDATWAAATVHLDPRALTVDREAPRTFLEHHRIIQSQLDSVAAPRGAVVSGIKKDVVITGQLANRPDRVAIYGWHYRSGRPIQNVYVGHVDWYVDYSHGIRPARRMMRVDGVPRTFESILSDSLLSPLLSDEGVMTITRYSKP